MKEIIIGLEIIKKYDGENADFAAEHDQIFAGSDSGKAINEITDEDRKILDENGWFIDSEFDCWSRFV